LFSNFTALLIYKVRNEASQMTKSYLSFILLKDNLKDKWRAVDNSG